MGRTASSRRWLAEHSRDPYVLKAQQQGWRSRAVFKLIEIQERDHILKPGQTVIDLGAAPGGWSQFAADVVGERGRVVALDRLAMDPLPGVTVVQADFREVDGLAKLRAAIADQRAHVVLSDLAPNISGNAAIDQPRSMHLAELALELCDSCLRWDGMLLVKVFQGEGSEAYIRELRRRFKQVTVRKPRASRPRSREVYALARNLIA